MQDVWALHPAMPNASNYFLEQLTQVQKLSLDGLFIWDHPVEAEAWWRVRFGWVPYHLCQMACAVSSRPRGAPVRLVENEAGDEHALVTRLLIWRWCDVVFRVAVSVWFHTELILCERDYFERPRSSGRRRSPPHGHTQIGMGEAVRSGTGLGRPRGHAPRRLHAHLALGSPSEKRAWRRWCLPRRTAATKRN